SAATQQALTARPVAHVQREQAIREILARAPGAQVRRGAPDVARKTDQACDEPDEHVQEDDEQDHHRHRGLERVAVEAHVDLAAIRDEKVRADDADEQQRQQAERKLHGVAARCSSASEPEMSGQLVTSVTSCSSASAEIALCTPASPLSKRVS